VTKGAKARFIFITAKGRAILRAVDRGTYKPAKSHFRGVRKLGARKK
jgi:DNA-binding protein